MGVLRKQNHGEPWPKRVRKDQSFVAAGHKNHQSLFPQFQRKHGKDEQRIGREHEIYEGFANGITKN